MKYTTCIIILVFMLGCSKVPESTLADNVDWRHDLPSAMEIAKTHGKPILVDFYAHWCSWCKRMDADTYANSIVANKLNEFVCVKIDTDAQPDIAEKYRIQGLPTTLFLTEGGKVIKAVPGYLPPDKFIELLEEILSI